MTAIQNPAVSPILRRIVGFCAALSVSLLPISSAAALEEVCAEMKIGVKSNVKAVILFQDEDGAQLGEPSELFGHGEFVCMPIPNGLGDNERFRVVYRIEPLSHEIPCGAALGVFRYKGEADYQYHMRRSRLSGAHLDNKEYGLMTPSVALDRIVFTIAKQGCAYFEK